MTSFVSRKYQLLGLIFCLLILVSLYVARLIDVQLVKGQTYFTLADQNRMYSIVETAPRGVLLDRYDDPVVVNSKRYFLLDNPQAIFSNQQPISREDALVKMASDPAQVVSRYERQYPWGEALAHIIGYTGDVTAEDKEKKPDLPLNKAIGKTGLELSLENQLQGRDGKKIYEIDARGNRQRLVETVEPTPGSVVKTSLDPYLNEIAWQYLQPKKGAVVISDPTNGEILALVSSPAYDPNIFSQVSSDPAADLSRRKMIESLALDPQQPFFNRALAGSYPPGSVFKIVTAMAGLENKAIDQNTKVRDEGVLKVGEYEYKSWDYWNYGRVEGDISLVRAITRSNDIYFYKVAEWTGPDKIAEMARNFGLGQAPGVEIGPQAKGLVPDTSWKEKTLKERWYLGNTYHMGIGQGDLLVSPLQVADMVGVVANRGIACKPSFLASTPDCKDLGLKPDHVQEILTGMIGACSSGGTAYPLFELNTNRVKADADLDTNLHNNALACKTGTAEFGGADARGRRKTHGWLALIVEPKIGDQNIGIERQKWLEKVKAKGFPKKLVITVLVESDDENPYPEGSKDAAPIVRKILDWIEGRAIKETQAT
jgi:penicillin-binding protein 2